ncbi:hypothetical protein Hdeb2414_s0010g00345641 [Helianthus debilis subsp. tardiflorus]
MFPVSNLFEVLSFFCRQGGCGVWFIGLGFSRIWLTRDLGTPNK